jgi:hypothetical protein
MKKTIITTSWDDGHPLDLKLAELLRKYDIPATFYIPIDNVERECMNPDEIKVIAQGFDVGGHTYHHVNLLRVPIEEAKREVVECKKKLEEVTGKEILSFSYPYGKFNNKVIKIVKKAGFIGARTVNFLTKSIKDHFKMGPTVYAADRWFAPHIKHIKHFVPSPDFSLLDFSLFWFMVKNNLFFKDWNQVAIETLDFIIKSGGIWHLWGHSWEIDENNDWKKLEDIFCEISTVSKEVLKVNNSQLLKLYSGKI